MKLFISGHATANTVMWSLGNTFQEPKAKSRVGGRTLSGVFHRQMQALVNTLDHTDCFFIKCLKPNDKQEPFVLNKRRLLKQLVTTGTGPVLELMGRGYPCRLTYDTLWRRYKDFLSHDLQQRMTPQDFAQLALEYLGVGDDQYQLGVSRVFLKFGVLQQVDVLINGIENPVKCAEFVAAVSRFITSSKLKKILSVWLVGSYLRTRVRQLRARRLAVEALDVYHRWYIPLLRQKYATKIQRFVRTRRDRLQYLRKMRCTQRLQLWWYSTLALRELAFAVHTSIQNAQLRVITSLLVANLIMREKDRHQMLKKHEAAARIQATSRGFLARQKIREAAYARKTKAARAIQHAWRKWSCRADMRTRRAPISAHSPTPRDVAPPKSPVFGTCKSRRLQPFRQCAAFNETREFWEMSMKTSPAAKAEMSRQRRSIFCDALTAPAETSMCIHGALDEVTGELSHFPQPSQEMSSLSVNRSHLEAMPSVSDVRGSCNVAEELQEQAHVPTRQKRTSLMTSFTQAFRSLRASFTGSADVTPRTKSAMDEEKTPAALQDEQSKRRFALRGGSPKRGAYTSAEVVEFIARSVRRGIDRSQPAQERGGDGSLSATVGLSVGNPPPPNPGSCSHPGDAGVQSPTTLSSEGAAYLNGLPPPHQPEITTTADELKAGSTSESSVALSDESLLPQTGAKVRRGCVACHAIRGGAPTKDPASPGFAGMTFSHTQAVCGKASCKSPAARPSRLSTRAWRVAEPHERFSVLPMDDDSSTPLFGQKQDNGADQASSTPCPVQNHHLRKNLASFEQGVSTPLRSHHMRKVAKPRMETDFHNQIEQWRSKLNSLAQQSAIPSRVVTGRTGVVFQESPGDHILVINVHTNSP